MALSNQTAILTKDMVLERVSELDIFEAYCPTRFVLNKPFSSPFRVNKNTPACVIHFKNNYFYFVDYGDSTYRGDCFDFVKFMVPGLKNFPEVLEDIDKRMGLKLRTDAPVEVSLRKKQEEQGTDQHDESKLFQVKAQRFTQLGADWWNSYSLSLDDLKRHKDVQTYFIERFWINKKLFYINYDELCFGHFFSEKYWKIYRPHANVEKGEWKWISNVPLKLSYGLGNLDKEKKGLGTKSVKDFYVTTKLKPETCGFQNESLAAISDEDATYIDENCSEFYLYFDNDDVGIKESTRVCTLRDWKWVNNPGWMRKFGAKDPSDMSQKFTLDSLEYHLRCKNII